MEKQLLARAADNASMFHFRKLDVYQCAVRVAPKAYAIASALDTEMANQLRRAALSISLNIAEGTGRFDRDQRKFLVIARGSALECAAVLDAATAIGVAHPDSPSCDELLVRIVSMLTRLVG